MPDPIIVVGLAAGAMALTASDVAETVVPPQNRSEPVKDNPGDINSWHPISASDVVARALAQRGLGWYKLGGGAIFTAPNCVSPQKNQFPDTCDCSGLVAYVFLYRRGPWNTDAIVRDALGPKKRFRKIEMGETVRPSDIIVKPGPDKNGDGQRDSPGHIGIITGVLPTFVRGAPDYWKHLLVTHSSGAKQNTIDPQTGKRYGTVRQTEAYSWKTSGYLVRALHVTL
jgi:hypothetical protein